MDTLRWKPGKHFGNVLRPLDVYLLEADLELHPILAQKRDDFQLAFNLATGETLGYKKGDFRNALHFLMKDEAATLPRITELLIITKVTPWCTTVHNDAGVSMEDICVALWKEYADIPLTEPEFKQLTPREQDRVQRMALRREAGGYTSVFTGMWGTGHSVPYSRCMRVDVLHGKTWFDGLERDDELAKKKLGFAAPNVFKLKLAEV